MHPPLVAHGNAHVAPPTRTWTPPQIARLAGALYVLIAALAYVAHFYVPGQLLVPSDAAATAVNISARPGTLQFAVGSELLILLSEASRNPAEVVA